MSHVCFAIWFQIWMEIVVRVSRLTCVRGLVLERFSGRFLRRWATRERQATWQYDAWHRLFQQNKTKKKGKGTKRGGKKNRWLGHHLVNKGQTGQTIVGAGAMGKNPAVLTIAFHLLAAWPAGPLKRNKKCITSVICIHTLPSFLFSCSFPSRFSFFVVHISRLSAIFVQRQSFIDVRHASAPRWIKRNATKMKLCGIGVEGRSEQEKTMRRYLKDAVVDVKSYWHVLHLVLIAESCLHVKGFPFSLGLFLRGQGYSPFFYVILYKMLLDPLLFPA